MTMPYGEKLAQHEYTTAEIPSYGGYICAHGRRTHEGCGPCGIASLQVVHPVYEFEPLEKPKDTTDHAAAAAEALEKIVAQLRAGRPPEDLGPDVILVGRMMARRT